jgi:hypothetical protein
LTLGYSHNTINLIDLLSPKPLALVIALLLSIGVFVFIPGEAQAEQMLTGVSQHKSVPASADPLAPVTQPPPVETLVLERYVPKTPSSLARGAGTHPEAKGPGILGDRLSDRQSPVLGEHIDSGPISLAPEHAAEPTLKQTATLGEKNELLLPLTERTLPTPLPKKIFFGSGVRAQERSQMSPERRYRVATVGEAGDPLVVSKPSVKVLPPEMRLVYAASPVATLLTAMAAPHKSVAPRLQTDVGETVVPKPVARAATLMPPPTISVGLVPSSATQSETMEVMSHPLPSLGPAGESAARTILNTVSTTVPGLSGLSDSAASSSESSSARTVVPSKGKTQPAPLTVPLDNISFGLSESGQTSSGGIGIPLLLGILAWSVLQLRRQDGFFSVVTWEIVKPGSALLGPLERPG